MSSTDSCNFRSTFATNRMHLKSNIIALVISLSTISGAMAQTESARGKDLLERNGCNSCHSVKGKGGCLAPPYDGISKRRSKDFILSRITNSAASVRRFEKLYPETELMPHPRISPSDAKAITEYLLKLPAPTQGFKATPHVVTSDMTNNDLPGNLNKGRALFFEKGCSSCHSVKGVGGQFAPALDGVGKREGRDYLTKKMTAAELLLQGAGNEYAERGTTMPPSSLSKQNMADIAEYLMTIPAK